MLVGPVVSATSFTSIIKAARKQRDQPKLDVLPPGLEATHTSSLMQAAAYGSINFEKLAEESLQRYQQVYGLGLHPKSSREERIWAVKHHFMYQQVTDEGSLLYGFIQAVRRDSSSDSSYSSM